jgi:hypothetical protein
MLQIASKKGTYQGKTAGKGHIFIIWHIAVRA